MERLSGIDASFLYMEPPSTHTHTIKVAVLTPAPGTAYTIERVRADLRARLHLLPPFRRRLVISRPFNRNLRARNRRPNRRILSR